MERILDVTTVRRQFGTLLDEVFYKGDVIIIERKGKPLAQIAPVINLSAQEETDTSVSDEQKQLLEELHGLPTISIDEDPTIILQNIRKQKRLKADKKYGG